MTPEQRTIWLAERRSGIGASEIAKVVGLAPPSWGGPLDVYADKLGKSLDYDNPSMEWGRLLEDVIAQVYALETGHELFQFDPPILRHPEHRWVISTPDRGIRNERKFVEIKRTDERKGWGTPGTDQVPEYYFCQTQWQMLSAVELEIESVDVAVLVGGSDFRIYTVERNQEIQQLLLTAASELWDRVCRQEPPAFDYQHPNTAKILNLLFHPDETKSIELDTEMEEVADAYVGLGEQLSEMERTRESYKCRIIEALGCAGAGKLSDGRVITRKVTKAGQMRLHVPARNLSEEQ